MFTAAIGAAGGIFVGVILGKCITDRKTQKWRERMENKQIDNEIRLDLLEYNHLHEDGFLRLVYEEK